MTDPDTAQAIEALAHRIRQRDTGGERADAEVFALEFMTALRARGWRATEAKVLPAWKPAGHKDPAAAVRGGALARELLAHRDDSETGEVA